MKRRISTLKIKKGYDSFVSFFQAMLKDSNLLAEFLDRVTINVSEFWRNPNRWETLEQKFIPTMAQRGGGIKCWSAACSTGEEPYTLAMILAERGVLAESRIYATDIDQAVLEKARQGVYPERSVRDVPAACLQQYFRRELQTYCIVDQLKKAVMFQQQNLLADTFDRDFDLIVCRNVMIYFTEAAKHLLYHKFAQALKPGGLLFVGSTEQIFSPGQYQLEPADTFFYRRR